MASLSNYLLTHRKRLTLSQEEVAFLVGATGMNKGEKVSRDENSARMPSLEAALAYEAIYGKPIRELFAGVFEQVERDVAARLKLLSFRKTKKLGQKRQQVLADMINRLASIAS